MNNHVTKPYYKPISIEKQYCKLEIPVSVYTKQQIIDTYDILLLDSDLKLLNFLAIYTHNFAITFPSQKRLSELTGFTERTIRRSLDRLREAGFVSTYQRWNNSLLYKISDIFQDFDVRRSLSKVCPAFAYLFMALLFSPQPTAETHGVRLINNLVINNPSRSHTNDIVKDPPSEIYGYDYVKFTATETEPNDIIKKPSKLDASESQTVRRQMEDHGGISKAIRDIKCISLTKFGQIKLSAFPDGSILYAVEQYKKLKNKPRDGFGWFFAVCGRWCQIYNIEPNWKYLEQLKERHHMPDGARMTFDTPDEQPFSAETGTGTVFKKETGRGKNEYAPRPPTIIPAKPEKTRDELIHEARTYLFAQREPGLAFDQTEALGKMLLESISKQNPDVIIEAQRLGPLPAQSPDGAQARIDARFAKMGIRKIEYRPVAPQRPVNLTQGKSYSRVVEEYGDEES